MLNFTFFEAVILSIISLYGFGHGLFRLVYYYPDAFIHWNWVASLGSYISVISLIVFFVLVYKTLTSGKKFEERKTLGFVYKA